MQKNNDELLKRSVHINEEMKKHINRTGSVVYDINEIQLLSGIIISLHYFKKIRLDFIHNVTSNKYSNFKLIIDILEKVLLIENPKNPNVFKELFEKMNRLGEIRNIFAHEFIINGTDWKSYFPSRKKEHVKWDNLEGVKVENLFEEFKEKSEKVKKQLTNIRGVTEATIIEMQKHLDQDRLNVS